jgi:hypothetical protein
MNIKLPFQYVSLESMPTFMLMCFGAPAFLVSAYFSLMFASVIQQLIETLNQQSILDVPIYLLCLLAFFAAITWYFGCLVTRCHSLLYERLFK